MINMHPSSARHFHYLAEQQLSLFASLTERVRRIKNKWPFPNRYSNFNTQLNPYFFYTASDYVSEAAAYSLNIPNQNHGKYYIYGDVEQPDMVEITLSEVRYLVLYEYANSSVCLYEFSLSEEDIDVTRAVMVRRNEKNRPIEIFSRLGTLSRPLLGYEHFAWENSECIYTNYLDCQTVDEGVILDLPDSYTIVVGQASNEVLAVVNNTGAQIFPPDVALQQLREKLNDYFDLVYEEAVRVITSTEVDQEVLVIMFEFSDQYFLDWSLGFGTQNDKDHLMEYGPLSWLGIVEWEHNYEADNLSEINDDIQALVQVCNFDDAEKEVFLFYKRLVDKLLQSENIRQHLNLSSDCYGIAQYACDGSDLESVKMFLSDQRFKQLEAEEKAFQSRSNEHALIFE